MRNQRQVTKSLCTALALIRAAGWVLLALSVMLLFAAGKAGPRSALIAFFASISAQGVATVLLLALRLRFRGPVGCEIWRQCSPFPLGAIMWAVFFAALYTLNWMNR
jgi:hypothetical protein